MAEKSNNVDIDKTLKGTVEEVTAALATMTAPNLVLLVEAEKGEDGEGRKGVVEAVEAEQAARIDLANETISAAVEAAEHAGMFLAVFTDPADFEEPGLSTHLKARVAELETAITSAEEAAKAKAPKPPKAKKQRELKISDKALPSIAALAFVGRDGRTMKDLPDLPCEDRNLKPERGGMTLMSAIEFPESPGKGRDLHTVYALDATGKAIASCNLVAPFPVGGAGKAAIAGGSLHFGNWPQPKTD